LISDVVGPMDAWQGAAMCPHIKLHIFAKFST
jgi:hypothetical protein